MTTALLAGGGTAGHVNPLLALADHWREVEPGVRLLVLGTAEGLEARLVPARGYELLTIPRVPFPRRLGRAATRFPRGFREAVRRTRAIVREGGVDVVVGFGGYAAAPAYWAARREGIPFVVHEANSRPGIANRLGRLLGGAVGVTFSATPLRGARVVGMPLRREIVELDRGASRLEAAEHFGLRPDRPTLLVTGGSTGARRLNETIAECAALILDAGWQLLHITGEGRGAGATPTAGLVVQTYCDRMDLAFALADLAVCRAGSATVSELAAVGLPAVLVPYAAGNGEQALNARELADASGALVVEDADFTPEWIARELVPLLDNGDVIARMTAAARSVGRRDGAQALLALVRETLDHPPGVG
jgi:UDP-N-acetylglucosamine--N-acetylmuramyl-(pentapeptide) pyrophosphoryl-undecaprenol N-acetylglucosamine transferase